MVDKLERAATIDKQFYHERLFYQKHFRADCPTPSSLNIVISHKPTKLLRWTLVNVKDPLPTLKQWNVVYPCSAFPCAYVCQTGWQLSTRMKVHKDAIRWQNALLPYIACQPATYLIGIERPSSEKGPPNIRSVLSRHGTLPRHVSRLDPGQRALLDYWRRRRQVLPKIS